MELYNLQFSLEEEEQSEEDKGKHQHLLISGGKLSLYDRASLVLQVNISDLYKHGKAIDAIIKEVNNGTTQEGTPD